jgi:hypothetical protein
MGGRIGLDGKIAHPHFRSHFHHSPKCVNFHIMRFLVTILFVLMVSPFWASGQRMFDTGSSPPKKAIENQWFLNKKSNSLLQFHFGEWIERKNCIIDVKQCHGFLIAQYCSHYYVGYALRMQGDEDFGIDRYFCGDSILVIWGHGWSGIYNSHDSVLTVSGGEDCQISAVQHQVQGMIAFCVSPPFKKTKGVYVNCKDLVAWGMIGENGKWLIPAIFDAPFEFQNGVAEVIYYGQKRKINEKGEFVE